MLAEFKIDLKRLNSTQVFRKYILGSDCFALTKEEQMRLKEDISGRYETEYNDVIVVGSAKLGFSIKPEKRYVKFGDDSDIDVAIVSKKLFEDIWMKAYLYKKGREFWPTCDNFFRYISMGWVRPDKLPNSQYFSFSAEWWEYFRALTSSGKYGKYKINAGIYHSHFFLTEYQNICIAQCQEEMK